jgi:hypothetical protein
MSGWGGGAAVDAVRSNRPSGVERLGDYYRRLRRADRGAGVRQLG